MSDLCIREARTERLPEATSSTGYFISLRDLSACCYRLNFESVRSQIWCIGVLLKPLFCPPVSGMHFNYMKGLSPFSIKNSKHRTRKVDCLVCPVEVFENLFYHHLE